MDIIVARWTSANDRLRTWNGTWKMTTLRKIKTKIRRVSKKRARVANYPDCHGIDFDEVRLHLPARVADWPTVVRVKDPAICRAMHEWFRGCWNCGWSRVEAHHIAGGTKGRSDEFCNIAMLCGACHPKANTAELPMGRILYLKWKFDKPHTDWVRLSLLANRFLPDLITD